MRSVRTSALWATLLACWGASSVRADDKKFTWSYEAKTLPEGTWEFEQWATLQEEKGAGNWSALHLADEIEYGITDRLSASVYLHSVYQGNSGVPGFANQHSVGFESMSTEWKYRLTDPSTDPVGIMLYEELGFANTKLEFETKLILSKEMGPWTFAYNFIYEPELLRGDDPAQSPQWTWEQELWNTFGASFSLTPQAAVGVEFVDVARYDLFNHHSTRADYVGPNLHLQASRWWATVTFLRQISAGHGLDYSDDDNTKFSVRLVFGVTF